MLGAARALEQERAYLGIMVRISWPVGFSAQERGYRLATMIDTHSMPRPGERWLSCPPYTLIAHILHVDDRAEPPLVTYGLQDDDGCLLESVEHAVLDEAWWRAFQPMRRRFG